MQAMMETIFDVCYLLTAIIVGVQMIRKADGNKEYKLFGFMAVILGFGDAFHLVPRAYSLWTTGLEANAAALGIGKLITSITMTVFYIILFHIWRMRYKIKARNELTYTIYGLGILRAVLCFMPQNQWTSYNAPLSWGIYRNIPFAIIGIIIIVIFYQEAKKAEDREFGFMWLAVLLSFALYAPVVLFADTIPLVGMLMIPKTLAYVWIIFMGYGEFRKGRKRK